MKYAILFLDREDTIHHVYTVNAKVKAIQYIKEYHKMIKHLYKKWGPNLLYPRLCWVRPKAKNIEALSAEFAKKVLEDYTDLPIEKVNVYRLNYEYTIKPINLKGWIESGKEVFYILEIPNNIFNKQTICTKEE